MRTILWSSLWGNHFWIFLFLQQMKRKVLCSMSNKIQKVVETIFEVIFSYLDLFRQTNRALCTLKICEYIPIFFIFFEIFMHFFNIQIFLILNLLSLYFITSLSDWNLNSTVSKIISYTVLKSAFTAMSHKTRCHNKQEMSNSVIILRIWTNAFISTLQARIKKMSSSSRFAILS
jgi:hypothetical protein